MNPHVRRIGHATLPLAILSAVAAPGCMRLPSSAPVLVPPPPPPPVEVSAIGGGPATTVVGSDFLYRRALPDSHSRAYGYLLFTKKPSPAQTSHYRSVCEKFFEHLLPARAFGASTPVVVTYWPMDTVAPTSGAAYRCDALIRRYDYAFAKELAQAAKKAAVSGPLLVAWPKPYRSGQGHSIPLSIDMSGLTGESIDSVFGVWQAAVVQDSGAWERTMALSNGARSMVQALNRFGATITGLLPKQ